MRFETIRRGAAAAILALLAMLPLAALAAPAAKSGSHPKAPLPDSVLARVVTGGAQGQVHEITRREMIAAAARTGRRLESLTPQDRRQFLDILIDQAVLVARVHHDPRLWRHADSTDYNLLRDRLVLRTVLDSAIVRLNRERAARGDSALPLMAAGMVLRDSAMVTLDPQWNERGLEKAVEAFDTLPRPRPGMSVMEQMRVAGARPNLTASDSAIVLARSSIGTYTLGELAGNFGHMNPLYRPRVTTTDNVKEMVANVWFENLLRKEALERGLEKRPDIAEQLARRAEYLDLQSFVAREVYEKIPMDSVSLRNYFSGHRSDFDFPERARVVRMLFPERAEAEAMVRRLTIPDEAESLAAQSSRAGVPYATILDAYSDSVLFRRMKAGGVGTVLGPDSTSQGWRALRVMSLMPRSPRLYIQARDMVKERWYNAEGERRMRALLDRLRREAVIEVNDGAVAKPLAGAGAGGTK